MATRADSPVAARRLSVVESLADLAQFDSAAVFAEAVNVRYNGQELWKIAPFRRPFRAYLSTGSQPPHAYCSECYRARDGRSIVWFVCAARDPTHTACAGPCLDRLGAKARSLFVSRHTPRALLLLAETNEDCVLDFLPREIREAIAALLAQVLQQR